MNVFRRVDDLSYLPTVCSIRCKDWSFVSRRVVCVLRSSSLRLFTLPSSDASVSSLSRRRRTKPRCFRRSSRTRASPAARRLRFDNSPTFMRVVTGCHFKTPFIFGSRPLRCSASVAHVSSRIHASKSSSSTSTSGCLSWSHANSPFDESIVTIAVSASFPARRSINPASAIARPSLLRTKYGCLIVFPRGPSTRHSKNPSTYTTHRDAASRASAANRPSPSPSPPRVVRHLVPARRRLAIRRLSSRVHAHAPARAVDDAPRARRRRRRVVVVVVAARARRASRHGHARARRRVRRRDVVARTRRRPRARSRGRARASPARRDRTSRAEEWRRRRTAGARRRRALERADASRAARSTRATRRASRRGARGDADATRRRDAAASAQRPRPARRVRRRVSMRTRERRARRAIGAAGERGRGRGRVRRAGTAER